MRTHLNDCDLDLKNRLQELRSRIRQTPTRTEELLGVIESLEEIVTGLEQERSETARWLRRLENNQRAMNAHVVAIENSLIFRSLRWLGRPLLEWKGRTARLLRKTPWYKPGAGDLQYQRWLQWEQITSKPEEWYRQRAEEFRRRLLFSVALPLHNPRRQELELSVQSLLAQTYPNWELCICDDASSESWVREYCAGLSRADSRVRFIHSTERLGVAMALNRACSLAHGEYVALFDQSDLLSPVALHHVAEAIQQEPADLIYTDEDRLDSDGRRVEPIFKPDWSPDLLLSCPYLGHLLVLSREALDRAGGARPGFDGAHCYDLALRLTDRPSIIRHIPLVLYHRRTSFGPAEAEPDAHTAGRRALGETLRRRNWNATVEDGPASNAYNVRWRLLGEPLISLIICSRSPKLLNRCLQAVSKRTDYAHRQVVVAKHVADGNEEAMERVISRHGVKRIRYEGPFHFPHLNNLAAEAADGEILVFLNDDVEPLVSSWLTDLAAQVQRPEIGVAGARLVYPSGSPQHAGIAIGIGDGCGHPGRGAYSYPYWRWLDLTRNVSAVTGACLAIRKQLFEHVGGFDERFPINYNDTDLCLRVAKAGYRIVYESAALLRHHEGQTRRAGVGFTEREQWYSCWADELDRGDPYYSPNLTRMREDASLRLEE